MMFRTLRKKKKKLAGQIAKGFGPVKDNFPVDEKILHLFFYLFFNWAFIELKKKTAEQMRTEELRYTSPPRRYSSVSKNSGSGF